MQVFPALLDRHGNALGVFGARGREPVAAGVQHTDAATHLARAGGSRLGLRDGVLDGVFGRRAQVLAVPIEAEGAVLFFDLDNGHQSGRRRCGERVRDAGDNGFEEVAPAVAAGGGTRGVLPSVFSEVQGGQVTADGMAVPAAIWRRVQKYTLEYPYQLQTRKQK